MKRVLLDTHVFLWWLEDNKRLNEQVKSIIENGENEIFVSAVTSWEISIKKSIGKLEAPDDIDAIVEKERFCKLPISLHHGEVAGQLPNYHKDPFDRMLIAQAQVEGLSIITADSIFSDYKVNSIKL